MRRGRRRQQLPVRGDTAAPRRVEFFHLTVLLGDHRARRRVAAEALALRHSDPPHERQRRRIPELRLCERTEVDLPVDQRPGQNVGHAVIRGFPIPGIPFRGIGDFKSRASHDQRSEDGPISCFINPGQNHGAGL